MFIPLSDHNSLDHIRAPWMTRIIVLATCLIWLIFQAGQENTGKSLAFMLIPSILFNEAQFPPNMQIFPEHLTLISYAFLHGGFLHLFGNMIFLWVFGDNVEDALGHLRFLIFYCACAAAGGIAHALSMPHSDTPLIGASGAVAGCVSAYLILHPHIRVWVLALNKIPLKIPAYWPLGAWIAFQIFHIWNGTTDETAWWAHGGGLIAGAMLIILMRRKNVTLFDRSQAL